MRAYHRTVCTLTAAIATCLAMPARGATVDWLLTLGVEHNDNINLSETDPVSGNIVIPGLGFSLTQEGSTVQANVTGALEYRDYLNSAFSDSTRAALNGQVNWTLSPQRLDWTFQDALASQPINEFAADAPGNRQQTNAFVTGPNIYFGLGKPLHGQVELRYVDSYAEKTKQFNSNRYSSALRLFKDFAPTRQLSGNLQVQKVKFTDAGAAPDFTRYDVYAGYTTQLAQLNLDLAAGYSRLDFQGIAKNSGGPLLRATLGWQASARSSFTGTFARQFTDAAAALLGSPGSAGVPPTGISTGNLSVTSQSYLERSVSLGYSYSGERLEASVAPYYRKLTYDNAPEFDRRGSGGRVSLSWKLRPLWRASISAAGENLRYNTLDRDDRTRTYAAGLAWQMSQRLSWHLDASHYSRNSNAIGQTSTQNIIFLSVALRR
ncbi:MAG: outer membrane beta-barrel protein [Rhodanobacteraceae bacterium]